MEEGEEAPTLRSLITSAILQSASSFLCGGRGPDQRRGGRSIDSYDGVREVHALPSQLTTIFPLWGFHGIAILWRLPLTGWVCSGCLLGSTWLPAYRNAVCVPLHVCESEQWLPLLPVCCIHSQGIGCYGSVLIGIPKWSFLAGET